MPRDGPRSSCPLWVCIRLPALPVEVFDRAWTPAEQLRPLVITSGGHHPRVVAMNAAATQAGIRREQLLSAALALAPGMAMRERDCAAEEEALAALATALLAFTPTACLGPAQSVLAEVRGSVRLFGGRSRLLAQIAEAVQALGHVAELGVAPTPHAALLLARTAGAPVLSTGALPRALADVPLALLDLAPAATQLLAAAGITSFGQMGALPRAGLARRCGADILAFIDRALGRVPDARVPYVPPPRFAARLPLPALVENVEALGFGVQRLVQQLARWLEGRGLGVLRLVLTLTHERHMRARGTPFTQVPFALGAPARDCAHLLAVLRERLVRVALPAPVEAIALSTEETAPLAGRNLGLLPGDESRDVAVPLFERLRARLGDTAVTRLATRADHRPELAQASRAIASTAPPALPHAARVPHTARESRVSVARELSASAEARHEPLPPRPLWLLEEAQPLGATLESRPWALRDGPERIESGWWDGRDFRRDYYVAQMPGGGLAWIYRDHRYGTDDGEWFLHGLYA